MVGFWQNGFFADFHLWDFLRIMLPEFFSPFCEGKSAEIIPPRKTPGKILQIIYTTQIPDTFLQRGWWISNFTRQDLVRKQHDSALFVCLGMPRPNPASSCKRQRAINNRGAARKAGGLIVIGARKQGPRGRKVCLHTLPTLTISYVKNWFWKIFRNYTRQNYVRFRFHS